MAKCKICKDEFLEDVKVFKIEKPVVEHKNAKVDFDGLTKRGHGRALTREEKIISYNVYLYYNKDGLSKSMAARKAAALTGLSVRSMWNIIIEKEKTGDFTAPSNKRRRSGPTEKLNEAQKTALRRIVDRLFLANDPPTLSKVLNATRKDDTFPRIGRTTLWKILRDIGVKASKQELDERNMAAIVRNRT